MPRRCREREGLSIGQTARRLGITPAMLKRIEAGKPIPSTNLGTNLQALRVAGLAAQESAAEISARCRTTALRASGHIVSMSIMSAPTPSPLSSPNVKRLVRKSPACDEASCAEARFPHYPRAEQRAAKSPLSQSC